VAYRADDEFNHDQSKEHANDEGYETAQAVQERGRLHKDVAREIRGKLDSWGRRLRQNENWKERER
jgi:hypothetical protein